MKSKKYGLFGLFLVIGVVLALLCAGCGSGKEDPESVIGKVDCGNGKEDTESVIGKTFVYEKEGFYGDFTISIMGDGMFTYYEGMASSFIGRGIWTIEHNTLTLTNSIPTIDGSSIRTNIFEIEKGKLIWRAEGSDNFSHVKVEDGEAFYEK